MTKPGVDPPPPPRLSKVPAPFFNETAFFPINPTFLVSYYQAFGSAGTCGTALVPSPSMLLPYQSIQCSLSLIRLCGLARSSPGRFSSPRCWRCRRTSCCSKGVDDSEAGSVNSGEFKPRGCVRLTLGRTGCSGCRWRRAVMPVQRARGSSLMIYMQVRGSWIYRSHNTHCVFFSRWVYRCKRKKGVGEAGSIDLCALNRPPQPALHAGLP